MGGRLPEQRLRQIVRPWCSSLAVRAADVLRGPPILRDGTADRQGMQSVVADYRALVTEYSRVSSAISCCTREPIAVLLFNLPVSHAEAMPTPPCSRRRMPVVSLLLISISPIFAPATASAQEPQTREEADRQRREQQVKEVTVYQPNGLERTLDFVEDRAIFILDREGFHPKLGSLTTGSGFAYGLGFRDRDLFSNRGALEIWAAGSVKRYWATEARLRFPRLAENRVYLETWASHRDYPQ